MASVVDSVAPVGAHESCVPEPVHDPLFALIAGQEPVVVGVPTLQLLAL